MQFTDFLILSGIVCGFITSFILIISAKNVNNRLLGISFFAVWWQALFYLLTATLLIDRIPYLYRVGAPLYYLIPPLNYLYVKNILKGRKSLSNNDYWHILPFFLAIIDLIPYYLSDYSTKLALVNAVMKDVNNCYIIKTGFLPSYTHFIIRPVQGILYTFFQGMLIYKATQKKAFDFTKPLNVWLIILTLLFSIMHLAFLVSAVIILLHQGHNQPFFQLLEIPKVYLSITFLCLCLCLFFFPKILYSLTPVSMPEMHLYNKPLSLAYDENQMIDKSYHPNADLNNQKKLIIPISDDKIDQYVARIETLMEESQCFMKELTLNDMANMLDMNHRYLSYILNNHYQLSFPDFVNGYRIRYILERIKAGDFKMLKLQAIATDAGFTSRTTFHNAFKKYTGTNPSQYIKELLPMEFYL